MKRLLRIASEHELQNIMPDPKKPSLVRPVVIGLIGGVASGKSFVGQLFEAEGAIRIDADRIGHEVLNEDSVRAQLVQLWGSGLLKDSVDQKEIDRAKLAKLVFGDSEDAVSRRRELEAIVHPRIRANAQSRIAAARRMQPPPVAVIVDAPLLLEADWGPLCDLILFIETPREERLARAMKRGWTPEQFAAREASQMSLDAKRRHATHIIDNASTEDSATANLSLRVKHLWEQIERCSA